MKKEYKKMYVGFLIVKNKDKCLRRAFKSCYCKKQREAAEFMRSFEKLVPPFYDGDIYKFRVLRKKVWLKSKIWY